MLLLRCSIGLYVVGLGSINISTLDMDWLKVQTSGSCKAIRFGGSDVEIPSA